MKYKYGMCRLMFVVVASMLTSCYSDLKTNNHLSADDRQFIESLGILASDEEIILFGSQGGFNGVKTSGNFFTDRRIASYWIDQDPARTTIDYAFYSEIDTIWRYPKYGSLTLASYLDVRRHNGTRFKVYVDADSTGTLRFFNRALEEWYKKKD